jgi:hypothetical protein
LPRLFVIGFIAGFLVESFLPVFETRIPPMPAPLMYLTGAMANGTIYGAVFVMSGLVVKTFGAAGIGFVLGFLGCFVFTVLALLFNFFGDLHPFLVPAVHPMRPISPLLYDTPGPVTNLLAATVNGIIYAVVVALVVRRFRVTTS